MSDQPTNLNYLSPLNFKFSIQKTPHVDFFCTDVNIPGIRLGEADQETPLVRVPIPGDHLSFDELEITFNVDEQMQNYKEMYDWLINAGFPESFSQYNNVGDAIFTDCSLLVLSSKMNPVARVDFENVYISSLSELRFSTRESDVVYAQCSATLRYKLFKVTLV